MNIDDDAFAAFAADQDRQLAEIRGAIGALADVMTTWIEATSARGGIAHHSRPGHLRVVRDSRDTTG